MKFRCEDVKAGDILLCLAGAGCCHRKGNQYVIEDIDGKLGYKPECWEQYHDYSWVQNADRDDFEIMSASGPW